MEPIIEYEVITTVGNAFVESRTFESIEMLEMSLMDIQETAEDAADEFLAKVYYQ